MALFHSSTFSLLLFGMEVMEHDSSRVRRSSADYRLLITFRVIG